MKKPKPPSRMMGTAGIAARKKKPDEKFGEQQQIAHQHQFSELESLFKIKGPDAEFRDEIVDLLDAALGFKAILFSSPKRTAVHQELHRLQTSLRRRPNEIEDAIADLSPEARHRLDIYGFVESSEKCDLPTIVKSAIDHTPKSKGGSPAKEHHIFLTFQFSILYEKHTGCKPSLSYNYYTGEMGGRFLDCLCILFQMAFSPPPTRDAIAQICKRLFYKAK